MLSTSASRTDVSARKFGSTAAVVAVITASAVAPAVARADHRPPQTPPSNAISQTLGNSVGTTVIRIDDCRTTSPAPSCSSQGTGDLRSAAEGTARWGRNPVNADRTWTIFQNRLWWFGIPNPNPAPRQTSRIISFTPTDWIPEFLQPLWGFFTQNINFEACILGARVVYGPYGTRTRSLTRGCG